MKRRSLALPLIILFVIAIAGGAIAIASLSLPSTEPTTPIEEESEPEPKFNYDWAENYPYIAHAFGGILGDSYTNSYEAFLLNYQLGHRVFEVDFSLTDDDQTVAAHDADQWKNYATINTNSDISHLSPDSADFTYANFKSSLWYGKYHPVDLEILFHILETYPDVYIVTDTKFSDEPHVRQQFTAFLEAARAVDLALLDRFIIQIYHPSMLDWVMDIYPWRSVIYTLYANNSWTPENVLEFAQTSEIKFITLWDSYLTTEISTLWQSAGIKIGTHTLNHLTTAADSRARGADVIYTDFLTPQLTT